MQKTYMAKPNQLKKKWYIIDASTMPLGRLAVKVATVLMGKHHPWYTPHVDTGDFVIVVNADKMKVTGKKRERNIYYSWTGYPGGLKKESMGHLMNRRPEYVVQLAVRRMLPKTGMGLRMLKKMKVYRGLEHPHEAQCPSELKEEKVTLKEVEIHD